MYKKTGESAHYLPRKGSYSTVPHRNGRVEVLPPNASEALYGIAEQMADNRARIEALKLERERLIDEGHGRRQIDRLRSRFAPKDLTDPVRAGIDAKVKSVDEEIASLRKHIGRLSALLGGTGVKTFEEAFCRVAEAELAKDVYDALVKKSHDILSVAMPRSNRLR